MSLDVPFGSSTIGANTVRKKQSSAIIAADV